MLLKKGTALYSVLKLKCPRCQNGDLFIESNPYKLSMVDKMPAQCVHCQLDFVQETGFYYGAMFVSYGLTIAFSVAVFLPYFLFFRQSDILNFIIVDSLGILLLFPVFLRLSRAVWLNLFEHYKKGLD